MSMKGMALLTGLMMAGMGSMTNPKPTRYNSPRNTHKRKSNPIHYSILEPDELKGHKRESNSFEYEYQNYTLNIAYTISYGSEKSKAKQISFMENWLREYIILTGIEDIQNFGQFTLIKKETPASKPMVKGAYEGICNRSACITQEPALYYNHSTREHYCRVCARLINEMNPESYTIYGHELCTLI